MCHKITIWVFFPTTLKSIKSILSSQVIDKQAVCPDMACCPNLLTPATECEFYKGFKKNFIYVLWASLVAQLVKNLPAMRVTWVQSLGWEEPLEKGKATHSSILAWRIPWTV